MGLTRFALRFALKKPKPESFDRFLFIGPHPDDIEIGAGAAAAALAAKGKAVCFLICTDGRFGDANVPETDRGDRLAQIQKEESIRSAEMLGVTDVRFLDLSDGGFYAYSDLVRGIAAVVSDFQPDVILAPDPSVTSETHKDHLNTGAAAREIANFAPYPGIMRGYGAEKPADVKAIAYYMTAKPNVFMKTSGFLDLQFRSVFDVHKSQFPDGSAEADSIRLYLKLRAVEYGIRKCCRSAEGFRLLTRTEMHCLPEAGD